MYFFNSAIRNVSKSRLERDPFQHVRSLTTRLTGARKNRPFVRSRGFSAYQTCRANFSEPERKKEVRNGPGSVHVAVRQEIQRSPLVRFPIGTGKNQTIYYSFPGTRCREWQILANSGEYIIRFRRPKKRPLSFYKTTQSGEKNEPNK